MPLSYSPTPLQGRQPNRAQTLSRGPAPPRAHSLIGDVLVVHEYRGQRAPNMNIMIKDQHTFGPYSHCMDH